MKKIIIAMCLSIVCLCAGALSFAMNDMASLRQWYQENQTALHQEKRNITGEKEKVKTPRYDKGQKEDRHDRNDRQDQKDRQKERGPQHAAASPATAGAPSEPDAQMPQP